MKKHDFIKKWVSQKKQKQKLSLQLEFRKWFLEFLTNLGFFQK
jgi:hypothetical protein